MEVTRGAIYILRDPRDVALSSSEFFGVPLGQTIETMSDNDALGLPARGMVYEAMSSWSVHVKSWTHRRAGNFLVVRYEDLLADPYGEFGKIARKLGITTEEARIRRAVEHASFKTLRHMEQETGFIERSDASERFFRSGRSGGWKDALTQDQAKRIERGHREQMKRFGYL